MEGSINASYGLPGLIRGFFFLYSSAAFVILPVSSEQQRATREVGGERRKSIKTSQRNGSEMEVGTCNGQRGKRARRDEKAALLVCYFGRVRTEDRQANHTGPRAPRGGGGTHQRKIEPRFVGQRWKKWEKSRLHIRKKCKSRGTDIFERAGRQDRQTDTGRPPPCDDARTHARNALLVAAVAFW